MIELRKAINEIIALKQAAMEGAFAHASTGPDAGNLFNRAAGVRQGLEMALDVLLNITKDDRDE